MKNNVNQHIRICLYKRMKNIYINYNDKQAALILWIR